MTTVQFQSCPVLCAALNGLSAGGDIDLTQRQGTTRTRERGYSLTPEGLSHPVEVIATGMADHLKMDSSKALSAARSHEPVPSLKYLITECQSPEISESGSTAPPATAPGSVPWDDVAAEPGRESAKRYREQWQQSVPGVVLMPMERTPVLLATDTLGRLNAIARKWRQSRSSVIRDAIQAGLDKLEATEAPQKVSSRRGRPSARRQRMTWHVERESDWKAFDRIVDTGRQLKTDHPDWDEGQIRTAVEEAARREHVYDPASTADRVMRSLRRIWDYEATARDPEDGSFDFSNPEL